jgi:copper chaperone CopZ
MEIQKSAKIIKSALAKVYGYRNVSVRVDSGTAYGWLRIRIEVEGSKEGVYQNAEKIIEESGAEVYTYTDDMGFEQKEMLISISQI